MKSLTAHVVDFSVFAVVKFFLELSKSSILDIIANQVYYTEDVVNDWHLCFCESASSSWVVAGSRNWNRGDQSFPP